MLELMRGVNGNIDTIIRIQNISESKLTRKKNSKIHPEINDYVEFSPPSFEEKISICKEVGIVNDELIETIVESSENFIELNNYINRLRNNAAQQFGFS